MLKTVGQNNPKLGKQITTCLERGELVPSGIVNNLIENRLMQPDCQVNGWVLDGFPMTESQVNLLKAIGVKPTVVFMLNQDEESAMRNIKYRRIDPVTGEEFNLHMIKFGDRDLN
jgi:adenylate kinase